MVVRLRVQIGENIIHNRTVSDFQLNSILVNHEHCHKQQNLQQRQQQRQGVPDWSHGLGAYNLGLDKVDMGQRVDIIAIYRRH